MTAFYCLFIKQRGVQFKYHTALIYRPRKKKNSEKVAPTGLKKNFAAKCCRIAEYNLPIPIL